MEDVKSAYQTHMLGDDAARDHKKLWPIVLKANKDINETRSSGSFNKFSNDPLP